MVLDPELECLGDRLVAAKAAKDNAKSEWAKAHWGNVYSTLKRHWEQALKGEHNLWLTHESSQNWYERYDAPGPLFWFGKTITRMFDRNAYEVDLDTLKIQREALRIW